MKQQGIELQIRGIVQGVGFRPFVYLLARQHGLTGTVANTGEGVTVRAEGPLAALDAFKKALGEQAPPLVRITSLEQSPLLVSLEKPDAEGNERSTFISPDVATCDDCLAELRDPEDRRYGYPYINCTNCGPRFTIVESIPYDQPTSTRYDDSVTYSLKRWMSSNLPNGPLAILCSAVTMLSPPLYLEPFALKQDRPRVLYRVYRISRIAAPHHVSLLAV